MTREQLTDTRRKIFCELDSYMKAVCKGTEYCKQWQLWSNCVVNFCDIMKDEIIFLEGIKVFDEILSKLIEEEGTAEEVSGNEVDENEHKKCIMRLEACKARKEKEIIKALQFAQVELEGDGYADGEIVYEWGKCPKCGWEFEEGDKDWEEPYCCHCGQKLHWFETQEVEE